MFLFIQSYFNETVSTTSDKQEIYIQNVLNMFYKLSKRSDMYIFFIACECYFYLHWPSLLYRFTTHDHLHNVKYSTYVRSAWWANQNLLYDLLAWESMTVKITFTRYEKYAHVTTFGLHETPQQAFTKFRNFCSGSYLILYSLILIQFWAHFTHFCLFRFVSVDLLLVSVQSKHRNLLFRYRSETTETKVLFRIVPKLVSVPVSVVSNRNYFRRTPYLRVMIDIIDINDRLR